MIELAKIYWKYTNLLPGAPCSFKIVISFLNFTNFSLTD